MTFIYQHKVSRQYSKKFLIILLYINLCYCNASIRYSNTREYNRNYARDLKTPVFTIGLTAARRSEGRDLHAVEGVYRANTSGQLGVFGARAIVCPAKQDIIIRTSRASLSSPSQDADRKMDKGREKEIDFCRLSF